MGKELEEADLQNKKARINAKISGLISANLADAYFWMEDFEKPTIILIKFFLKVT